MKTAIVDGIERQGFNWISLQCQRCDANYHGGNGSTKPGSLVQGYKAHHAASLCHDARTLGWTGPMTRNSNIDLCPDCSKQEFGDGNTLNVMYRSSAIKLTQWFKPGDHPAVKLEGMHNCIELIFTKNVTRVEFVTPGNFIVEFNDIRLMMSPEEVAQDFVLPSDSHVNQRK